MAGRLRVATRPQVAATTPHGGRRRGPGRSAGPGNHPYTVGGMVTTTQPGGNPAPFLSAGADGGDGGKKPPRRHRHKEPKPPRPPLGPVRRTIREIGLDLITAGIMVLLFVGYQLWGTGLAEANSQSQLKKQFSSTPTTQPVPGGDSATVGDTAVTTPAPPTGAAIAHLVIPKIDVDKFVVEGVNEADLRKGPGHYPGTPMPGEPGNASIAGHRTTYGAPFYRLNELHAGDDIFVTTAAGRFHYVVSETKVVSPDRCGRAQPDHRQPAHADHLQAAFQRHAPADRGRQLTDLPAPPAKRVGSLRRRR